VAGTQNLLRLKFTGQPLAAYELLEESRDWPCLPLGRQESWCTAQAVAGRPDGGEPIPLWDSSSYKSSTETSRCGNTTGETRKAPPASNANYGSGTLFWAETAARKADVSEIDGCLKWQNPAYR